MEGECSLLKTRGYRPGCAMRQARLYLSRTRRTRDGREGHGRAAKSMMQEKTGETGDMHGHVHVPSDKAGQQHLIILVHYQIGARASPRLISAEGGSSRPTHDFPPTHCLPCPTKDGTPAPLRQIMPRWPETRAWARYCHGVCRLLTYRRWTLGMPRRAGHARVNVRPHATVTAWDSMSLVEPGYGVLICSSLESSFRPGPLAVCCPWKAAK